MASKEKHTIFLTRWGRHSQEEEPEEANPSEIETSESGGEAPSPASLTQPLGNSAGRRLAKPVRPTLERDLYGNPYESSPKPAPEVEEEPLKVAPSQGTASTPGKKTRLEAPPLKEEQVEQGQAGRQGIKQAQEQAQNPNVQQVSPVEEREDLIEMARLHRIRQRQDILTAIISVIVLGLLGFMDFPYLVRLMNERSQSRAIEEYVALTAELTEEDTWAKLVDARVYNGQLFQRLAGTSVDPFSQEWKNPVFADANSEEALAHTSYSHLLSADPSRIMGFLSVPKVDVKLPFYYGYSEDDLLNGACHLEGTTLPVGGSSTNACIFAYRGYDKRRLFSNLQYLEKGDLFFIHVMSHVFAYRVMSILDTAGTNLAPMQIRKTEDLVTLISVEYDGSDPHRTYITGTRVRFKTGDDEGIPCIPVLVRDWWWAAVTLAGLILLKVVSYKIHHPKGAKAGKGETAPKEGAAMQDISSSGEPSSEEEPEEGKRKGRRKKERKPKKGQREE